MMESTNNSKLLRSDKGERIITIVFGIVFIVVSIILFWRCKFGYVSLDEACYLIIPYRFIEGDKILFEEWHATQLCAVVLIPMVRLYMKIVGSTKGIYLIVRNLYTIWKCVMAIFIYYKLKKYNKLAAMLTSLLILFYAGYGVMAFSYNSFARDGLICTVLLMMIDSHNRLSIISYIAGGVALSVAVLGIPHVAVMYVVYLLIVIALYFSKRNISNLVIRDFFSIKTCAWISTGVGLSVLIFAVYVLCRTSVAEIIQTIPQILFGDPEHPVKKWWRIIPGYLANIAIGKAGSYTTLVIYGLLAIEFIGVLIDRKRYVHKVLWIWIVTLTIIILQIIYFMMVVMGDCANWMIFAPNVLTFFYMILLKEEIRVELFVCIWFPGMVFSFLEYIASNTGFNGISSASLVATVGSIMMIVSVALSFWNRIKIYTIVLSIFVLLTLCTTLYARITYIFNGEGKIREQTELLMEGPQAGIFVSKERYERYNGVLKDTEELRSLSNNLQVLYLGDKTLWLAGEQRCAIYSPWSYEISTSRDILYKYYEEHPDKMADMVYIESTYDYKIVEEISTELGMNIVKKDYGYLLSR